MSDEQREIIETIRDRRDRAVDAHGRTAAAMDVMHLSPFEQAVYVDAALNTIDRLTAERDAARAEVERLRDILSRLFDAFGTPATRETETNLSEAMTAYEAANMKDEAHVLRTSIEAIRAALGIEADHD